MGSNAYLLVGIEAHTYVAMLYLVVVAQVAHSIDKLRYASLIVGSEQRVSVGDDEVLADMGVEFRELRRRGDDAGRELYVATLVCLHDMRVDILAAAVGTGVIV